jgi:hypothetical protein
MPRSKRLPTRLHARTLGLLGLIAGASLLLIGCDGTDAADPESTPAVIATVEDSRDNSPTNGGGIEPANPDSPPAGVLGSSGGSVALGLGSYCWSPPQASGNPAICADAIGIITNVADLPVTAGETLTITGDLSWPPMSIAIASLWTISGEPVTSGDDFRAWHPEGAIQGLQSDSSTITEHTVTLPEDLAPGRYLLAVNYTAGPDRGSDATYGAILVIE